MTPGNSISDMDVYERVQKLADYLEDLIDYADKREFPSDEWLSEIEKVISEVRA